MLPVAKNNCQITDLVISASKILVVYYINHDVCRLRFVIFFSQGLHRGEIENILIYRLREEKKMFISDTTENISYVDTLMHW